MRKKTYQRPTSRAVRLIAAANVTLQRSFRKGSWTPSACPQASTSWAAVSSW
ncbi:MAG: hypothetical protein IJ692_05395 [Alloprevotella sp.]|nr:hypothetical protein [Alloprevotella sp.]